MGPQYSQPPRGFQYSAPTKDICNRMNPDTPTDKRDFSTFHDLYFNDFEIVKNLPYLRNHDKQENVTTIGMAANKTKGVISKLIKSGIKQGAKIAIFAEQKEDSFICLDAMMLGGYQFYAGSPELIAPTDFAKKVQEIGFSAIICTPLLQKYFKGTISAQIFLTNQLVGPGQLDEMPTISPLDECVIVPGSKSLTQQEICQGLGAWSQRIHVCRDVVFNNQLFFGHPFDRLIHCLAIYNRCVVEFDTNPANCVTHLLVSPKYVQDHLEQFNRIVEKHPTYYSMKHFWTVIGSETKRINNKLYQGTQPPIIPKELHCVICSDPLPRDVQDKYNAYLERPIASVFLPLAWGNNGAALPIDNRFTKGGTAGGPVVSNIEAKDGTISISPDLPTFKGHWDEEGSLVVDE